MLAKSFCWKHYYRFRRYGDPLSGSLCFAPLEVRLLSKRRIDPVTGCWEWTGVNCFGYGLIPYKGKMVRTHRAAAFLWLGIPLGSRKLICHKCDNPPCFNPDHLFAGTHADNMRDMVLKGRSKPRKGVENGNSRLTEDDVRAIRRKRIAGVQNKELRQEYGLTRDAVIRICNGRRWPHLLEPGELELLRAANAKSSLPRLQ